MSFEVQFPDNCIKSKPRPLLIALHGYGDNQQNFKRLFVGRNDMTIVIPESAYPFSNGKEIGYSWTCKSNPKEDLGKESMLTNASNIRKIIEYMKANYNVTKVYLFGFSQGAGLAYIAGIKNYDLVDGIAPFGGWLDAEYLTKSHLKFAKNIDVYIAHGKNDSLVDIETSYKAKSMLIDKNYNVVLNEFNGGHQVPAKILESALNWLKEQN